VKVRDAADLYESAQLLPGLIEIMSPAKDMVVRAVIARCPDLSAALELPQQLGLRISPLGPSCARVDLRGVAFGARLSMYFVQFGRAEKAQPDNLGLICLTFVCKDAERMAALLADQGHDVGPRFVVAPFGATVRVFFVRTTSGELYEFLSIQGMEPISERKLM
jgi:hypothetical protein